jgi:NDP-sugar pyrophosphorylase family protein
MKTLIIPCAGKGKRMYKYFFPKPLLPLKQRPILFQIIDYWKPYINHIVIVLSDKNNNLIREYIKKYYLKKTRIDYCIQSKINGTYFAIKKAIDIAENQEIVLNWSDICLDRKKDIFSLIGKFDKNYVLTTDKIECRWKVANDKFYYDKEKRFTEKGIFGVFLISNKDNLFSSNINNETDREVEILEALDKKTFQHFKFEHFYDIGDDNKYSNEVRRVDDKSGVRAFGSCSKITINEGVVIKYTHNKKLKKCEQNWYKNVNFNFVPRVISYDPLILERLKAIPANDKILSNPNNEIEDIIIKQLFSIAKSIHTSKGIKTSDFASSYDQYYAKTISRLKRVDFLFTQFNKNNFTINGKVCRNPIEVLKENEEKITSFFPEEFRLIHGDLQLSNTLIDKKNNLYVIDPRGYFGNSELFGDPMYDFAKMFYGFCGMYGIFSTGKSKFIINKESSFDLEPLLTEEVYVRRRNKFLEEFNKVDYVKGGMEFIDLLHAIIWLSVTDYTANDVLSCLYAYLKGTELINEIYNFT